MMQTTMFKAPLHQGQGLAGDRKGWREAGPCLPSGRLRRKDSPEFRVGPEPFQPARKGPQFPL